MDEALILEALQQGVTDAVLASIEPQLPVSYVEVTFNTPDDNKWLEIVHFPNNMQGDFWGNEKNHRGILRLILHWPNNGGGPYGPLQLLGSISDYFWTGRVLSGVKVYSRADFTGIVQDGDDSMYPVSIRYESFRKGP